MNEEVNQSTERSNRTLWILIASFAIPMIAAYVYYFLGDDFSRGNNGKLISPMINIESLSLTDEAGQLKSKDELTHKWKMLYVVGSACDAICSEKLYLMRQMNKALGKNAHRFQHMLIHTDKMSEEFDQLIKSEHTAALHSYTSKDTLSQALNDIDKDLTSNSIYIMDPLGNIMMQYSPDITPKQILKDLKRLLKISRIG